MRIYLAENLTYWGKKQAEAELKLGVYSRQTGKQPRITASELLEAAKAHNATHQELEEVVRAMALIYEYDSRFRPTAGPYFFSLYPPRTPVIRQWVDDVSKLILPPMRKLDEQIDTSPLKGFHPQMSHTPWSWASDSSLWAKAIGDGEYSLYRAMWVYKNAREMWFGKSKREPVTLYLALKQLLLFLTGSNTLK